MNTRATLLAAKKGQAKRPITSMPKGRAAATDKAAAPTFPARRGYAPQLDSATVADLPFTQGGEFGEPLRRWAPAEVEDYGQAYLLGMEYAAHLMQFKKDNPGIACINMLGHIVADMDFKDKGAAKGCIVGFFVQIERAMLAAAQAVDVFKDLDAATAHLRPEHAPTKRGGKHDRAT
ncbi:hypothetical protein HNP55_001006 [Paucibacter oligotrophus]|uniref:Uncharacterized protein n=1 Tax=Roseateles oligotrophus TaxID=1769250 RepID=A0A840L3V7_9BURK|nr:hypothetical protein [Roseateles oligotrophus]MBB4842491.1 hypothetical protein [Roseateles oligotrophus]